MWPICILMCWGWPMPGVPLGASGGVVAPAMFCPLGRTPATPASRRPGMVFIQSATNLGSQAQHERRPRISSHQRRV